MKKFLTIAARLRLRPVVTTYSFEHASNALADLAGDKVTGVAVLQVATDT